MALVFCDSFDHYATSDLLAKYTALGPSNGIIDRSSTYSRTGAGCYRNTSGPFGPSISFGSLTTIFVGVAVNPGGASGTAFSLFDAGTTGTAQARVRVNSDGSLSVIIGNDPFPTATYTTVPAKVNLGAYNYLELKLIVGSGAAGSFDLHANGFSVLTQAGINTQPGAAGVNTVQLNGPGGGLIFSFDDFYILNSTNAGGAGKVSNNDFLGPVRIYAEPPIADSTPLQWTPTGGGAHYTQVREIPPDGGTTGVSDATVGHIDHYLHGIVGIPGGAALFAVQHCLDAAISDAGARQIASEADGHVGTAQSLTTSYHMVCQPWDNNPTSGLQWVLADFAAFPIGPKVTA